MWLIFFFSGAAGLAYQVVWARMLAGALGQEMPAVLAVVCGVMAGLAVGAGGLDGTVSRSLRSGRAYALLEFSIGLWGAAGAWLIPALTTLAARWIGLDPAPGWQWWISFCVPLVLLFPATAAMGATFPAMERLAAARSTDRSAVAAVYSANTLGAAAGVLLAVWWLMPSLGFRRTLLVLAGVNVVCGAAAWYLQGRVVARPRTGNSAKSADTFATRRPLTWVLLGISGFLGIGYETMGIRVLAQVLENTIYTFASVLAVFLAGTAIGAGVCHRWGRSLEVGRRLHLAFAALGIACALGMLGVSRSAGLREQLIEWLGRSMAALAAVDLALAAMVFVVPTFLMGAIFSYLAQSVRQSLGGVGLALAVNTLGGAVAPLVFGVVLLPWIGSTAAATLLALAYVGLGWLAWANPVRRGLKGSPSSWGWVAGASGVVLGFAVFTDLRNLDLPPGVRLRAFREGVAGNVAVFEEADGHRTLRVDNRFQMGGTGAEEAEVRQAHLPLLLHPRPRQALFLGLGTGITMGAAAVHPDLGADGVELLPEVVEVIGEFESANRRSDWGLNLRVRVADARRYVVAAERTYDVVVADLFHPARDGAGLLYTREHFAAVRSRLAPAGLFCQWLPLHQMDDVSLRGIVRTFLEVFPESQAWLLRWSVDAPVLGLMGFTDPAPMGDGWIESRLGHLPLQTELRRLALADSVRFFGHAVADARGMRRYAGNAPLNTDDRPVVTFAAPRLGSQPNRTSYGRLFNLLDSVGVVAAQSTAASSEFTRRWGAFRAARDVYLRGLATEIDGRQGEAIDAFVESARLSPDFTAGYARCLTVAAVLRESQPAAARRILERLVAAQPGLPVAGQMLERMESELPDPPPTRR